MTRRGLSAFVVLIGLLATARADVSPEVYDEWRAKADEAILIEVVSVATKGLKDGSKEVEVTARVVAVERSKAGLKKGSKVIVRYENQDDVKDPPLGSSWAPLLEKEEFYPAFLEKVAGKDHFKPAAQRMSFTMSPAR